jgi:hypothetical protein
MVLFVFLLFPANNRIRKKPGLPEWHKPLRELPVGLKTKELTNKLKCQFNFWIQEKLSKFPSLSLEEDAIRAWISHRALWIRPGVAFKITLYSIYRLCGLVVRVLGYRSGGPGSIPGTTRFSGGGKKKKRKKVVGLERGPLSLVSTTEELLDIKVAAPV